MNVPAIEGRSTEEGQAMDLPTQTHLKALRDWLQFRRHELQAEVHEADLARQDEQPGQSTEVSDQKDAAGQNQRSEVIDAQQQRDRDELAQVDAALLRLDEGRYGDCRDCGEPISLQRLQVQPAALRCAACQSAFEHSAAQRKA
jgi:DnaK suppressor protein